MSSTVISMTLSFTYTLGSGTSPYFSISESPNLEIKISSKDKIQSCSTALANCCYITETLCILRKGTSPG